MIIRKEFKYEMGHMVRNAFSERCAYSPHGHSYTVEFLMKGNHPDNGQMLMDFGFLKQYFHPYVDSFDHSFWLWDRPQDQHIVKFFQENFNRVITSPFSTSAEVQAKLFCVYGQAVLDKLHNDDGLYQNHDVNMHSVRVHETTTGWAEYSIEDDKFPNIDLASIRFSKHIIREWSDAYASFYNQLITQR